MSTHCIAQIQHAFTVNAGIDRVWEFYTDIGHLEAITLAYMQLRVMKSTTGRKLEQGSEVWITGKLVTKTTWHSKFTSLRPYEYTEEMLSGRFDKWKHVHAFRTAGDGREIIDEIDFELQFRLIGRMFEGYVYGRLKQTFAHRKEATIRALS